MPTVTSQMLTSIELIVSDIDGVWTDGRLLLGEDGREMKVFNVRDGQAVAMAREAGLPLALLSGRTSGAVDFRARELGIAEVVQGSRDKRTDFLAICRRLGAAPERTVMMGDDLPDLPAFEVAGLSVAPADAASEVRAAADLITTSCGGDGVLREFIEQVLAARTQSSR